MTAGNERIFGNRERAESFGRVAVTYDRVRPGYPVELIDELAARRPARVLDVGCGTGRAALALAERGLSVLGVEIDPQMAEVARSHGIDTEVGAFETWEPHGRRFDLIVCGQAWHWIDPEQGAAKAHALLRPSGGLALFWNIGDFDEVAGPPIDRVYEDLVPGLARSTLRGGNRAVEPYRASLLAAGFTDFEVRSYPWEQRYTRAEWLALVGTHSDHSTLPPALLARLLERLGAVIDELGGSIVTRYRTETLIAARTGVAG